MGPLSKVTVKRLTLCLLLLSSPAWAKLPKPQHFSVSTSDANPSFSWDAVEGASYYRLAVFSPADDSGKRHLLAAAWLDGQSWSYGSDKVIAKVGKLPSSTPKPLIPGVSYRAMLAAADESGADKSDWVSLNFVAPSTSVQTLSTTASPSPTPGIAANLSATATASPTPADAAGNSQGAELDMDLAAEFKETPTPGIASSGAPNSLSPSVEAARSLLQAGQAAQSEAMFKQLLDSDATNADYWEGLGDSYDAQMMKIEAKEAYQKALDIDPKRDRLTKWMDDNVKQ